jgi:hypothetical protein
MPATFNRVAYERLPEVPITVTVEDILSGVASQYGVVKATRDMNPGFAVS